MDNHSRLSNIFNNMKKRCYNPNCRDYKNYGARGITVCEEWLDSSKANISNCTKGFIAFQNWALAHGYSDKLTLDRIDVNGIYEPTNCRWISIQEQENNRRNNYYITYQNKTQSLSAWCKELNLNYYRTFSRIRKLNWAIEEAFTLN